MNVLNSVHNEAANGPQGLWNVPVESIGRVGQFWDDKLRQFLQHPVYGKSYQADGAWPNPKL